jgi:hypothetical protein
MPLHGMGHRIEFDLVSNAGAAEGGSFSTRRERVERPEMGFDCLINPQDMKRPRGGPELTHWRSNEPRAAQGATMKGSDSEPALGTGLIRIRYCWRIRFWIESHLKW